MSSSKSDNAISPLLQGKSLHTTSAISYIPINSVESCCDATKIHKDIFKTNCKKQEAGISHANSFNYERRHHPKFYEKNRPLKFDDELIKANGLQPYSDLCYDSTPHPDIAAMSVLSLYQNYTNELDAEMDTNRWI